MIPTAQEARHIFENCSEDIAEILAWYHGRNIPPDIAELRLKEDIRFWTEMYYGWDNDDDEGRPYDNELERWFRQSAQEFLNDIRLCPQKPNKQVNQKVDWRHGF